jgi:serine/threonine-protein kinase
MPLERELRVSSKPEVGVVIAEKYRLERLLKKGGMGSVWVATHLALGTPVAIKFMDAARIAGQRTALGSDDGAQGQSTEAETHARFEREARAAARLRSSNIVQVLDYGVDGALPYLVMELLEGEDLGARLAREGRLSIEEAVRILRPVALALERAHGAQVVHRDLKPENIFIAKEGDQEVPKVLDFGVAKAIHGGDVAVGVSTLEGTVVGSPHYISPEQAMGKTDIDARSDLWSLGVVVFHVLTGRKPFRSKVLLEAVVEICSAPIPRAKSVAPDLPDAVDVFLERALCREVEGRFQSAKEMGAALLALREAAALPVSVHEEPARPSRARRIAMLGAALGLVVLGAGMVLWRSQSTDSRAPTHTADSASGSVSVPRAEPSAPTASESSTPVSSASASSAGSASPANATAPSRGSNTQRVHRPATRGRDVGY